MEDPLYYANLYNSQEVYLALLSDKDFYAQILAICKIEAIPKYSVKELFDGSQWEFRLPEDVIDINDGHLTIDIDLYFT